MTSARRRDHVPEGLLFIGGKSSEATQVFQALSGEGQPPVEWARSLAEGLARLRKPGVTSILLNLSLPDSTGIDTFDKTARRRGRSILVMSASMMRPPAGWRLNAARTIFSWRPFRSMATRAVASLAEYSVTVDALFEEKERAEVTLNSIGDAVLCTDISGNVTY